MLTAGSAAPSAPPPFRWPTALVLIGDSGCPLAGAGRGPAGWGGAFFPEGSSSGWDWDLFMPARPPTAGDTGSGARPSPHPGSQGVGGPGAGAGGQRGQDSACWPPTPAGAWPHPRPSASAGSGERDFSVSPQKGGGKAGLARGPERFRGFLRPGEECGETDQEPGWDRAPGPAGPGPGLKAGLTGRQQEPGLGAPGALRQGPQADPQGCRQGDQARRVRGQERVSVPWTGPGGGGAPGGSSTRPPGRGAGCGAAWGLTGGASVEVVVVLGHVGQDAQPVGHLQGHHVLGVQQGRDAQLLLRHEEGLGEGQAAGSTQGDATAFPPARPPAPPGGTRGRNPTRSPEKSGFKVPAQVGREAALGPGFPSESPGRTRRG